MKLNYKIVSLSEGTEEYLSAIEVRLKVASKMLGMSDSSLKKSNIPCTRTIGGHRKYNLMSIIELTTALTSKVQKS